MKTYLFLYPIYLGLKSKNEFYNEGKKHKQEIRTPLVHQLVKDRYRPGGVGGLAWLVDKGGGEVGSSPGKMLGNPLVQKGHEKRGRGGPSDAEPGVVALVQPDSSRGWPKGKIQMYYCARGGMRWE